MHVILQPVAMPDYAARFIAAPFKLSVDRKWVAAKSGKALDVFDPSNGKPIAKAAEGDAADIDAVVKAARRAFESGPCARTSPLERSKLIYRPKDTLEAKTEEAATRNLGPEMGKEVLDLYTETKAVAATL
jgi:phenylacetaldehyde dehydrogenase